MAGICHLQSLVLLAIPLFVLAQSNLYGQCGGITWPGPTTCVPNAVCVYQNPWYSQCLSGTPPAAGLPNYLFNFGDSFSQTGFNVTDILPNASNPLGNPAFPGQTSIGGENWVGFVTFSFNNSVLYTYNFANDGATIDSSLVAPLQPFALSLVDQVDQFLNSVAKQIDKTPWTSDNSLFSIWIGSHDISSTYDGEGDQLIFSDGLLDSYFVQIQKLYDIGARNFLFANIPPLDRSPAMLNQSSTTQALQKSVIDNYNFKLQDRITVFTSNHTQMQIFLWDTNAQFSTILDNPLYFEIQDITSYGSSEYMFWADENLPGVATNKLLGRNVGLTLLNGTKW